MHAVALRSPRGIQGVFWRAHRRLQKRCQGTLGAQAEKLGRAKWMRAAELAECRAQVASARITVSEGCITRICGADAVMNSANEHLVGTQLPYINIDGSGGCIFDCVDRALHKQAGPDLHEACMALPIVEGTEKANWGGIRCPSGEARVTPAFGLQNYKYIVHVVGPPWPADSEELRDAYHAGVRSALEISGGRQLVRSLAVPALSSGINQWPRDMSWAAAVQALGEHLLEAELMMAPQTARLEAVILAAWDAASAKEARECVKRWADGTLTEDGLL